MTTETVYTVSGTPDPNSANPVAPTLADAVTAARVHAQKSTDAAASAAASAIAADVSADAVTEVVSGVVGQVTADAAQVAADRIAVHADALAADADAGTAVASAAAALSSEGTASSAAISSASSASTASGNAVAAAASFDSFHNIYYGPSATNPTTRPDSSASVAGDLYYNTSSTSMKIYTGSSWASAAFDTSGALVAANNLSELADKKAARNNLGIDGRTSRGNADYSILTTDIVVAITSAFTAPRTFTLPGAAYVNAGARIRIVDEIGGVSSTNTLTVASLVVSDVNDTINGGTSIVFASSRLDLTFVSNGVSKWSVGVTALVAGGTGATTASTARTALGLGTAATRDAAVASGVATLDGSGKVVAAQLPPAGFFTSTAKSANYTTTVSDNGTVIAVTTGSSTDVNITLGAASLSSDGAGDGAVHGIQKVDSGTKKVIVLDNDGATVLAWLSNQWDLVLFKSNGSVWKSFIITISPRVDTFNASGTWTKPPLAASVKADVRGSGGGGGSGRRGATSEAKGGGAGGSGGAFYAFIYNAADLSATETVTVGVAGTAGAAQSSNSTDGNNGGNGGATLFGTRLTVAGGLGGDGASSGGSGGKNGGGALGATTSAAPVGFEGGTIGNRSIYGGAGSGSGSPSAPGGAGASSWFGGGGGGAGGGEDSSDTLFAPGAGGSRGTVTAGAGGTVGTSHASTPVAGGAGGGIGIAGGGGGSAQSAAAAAGGAGGIGAGGGGGGASRNGNSSGAGGLGGVGQCVVTTFFLPN